MILIGRCSPARIFRLAMSSKADRLAINCASGLHCALLGSISCNASDEIEQTTDDPSTVASKEMPKAPFTVQLEPNEIVIALSVVFA